ncbi:MAG: glycerol-3-phosphate 1-O-acyltransferase PlsY [Rhodothermales bacterium]
MLSLLVIVLLSYLVGSIPGSIWTGKLMYGIDVREHGSGNAGATNTFRVLGWKAGWIATIVDMGKGLLAAGLISQIRIDPIPVLSFWDPESFIKLVAGLAAILGHNFPVFAGFKGGKGVNTTGGVLFALTPISMVLTLLVFGITLFTTRYVSVASMLAALSFPTIVAIRKYVFGIEYLDGSLLILSLLMMASILWMHRSNIGRLRRGEENRVKSFAFSGGMRGKGEIKPEDA